jgi:hypothetical protein
MERRFDMTDFEGSLKDHADQFRMIPSKRVWNGIYNNLHPGSKWPSITVAIIFLFTLITIGKFNTSTDRFYHFAKTTTNPEKNVLKSPAQLQSEDLTPREKKSEANSLKTDEKKNDHVITANKVDSRAKIISGSSSSGSSSTATFSSSEKQPNISPSQRLESVSLTTLEADQNTEIKSPDKDILNNDSSSALSLGHMQQNQSENFVATKVKQGELIRKDFSLPVSFQISDVELLYPASIDFDSQLANASEIIFNQELSLNPLKNLKKNKNKIEWIFYVNPIISTVSFNKKTIRPSAGNPSLVVLSGQAPFKLMRNPRFGMETGAEMSFVIDKKFKFITGLNLSYWGYNNLSNLVHPTFTTLTLNDGKGGTYSQNYVTHFGNGQSPGHVPLINYNIQASLPLGVKFNIWGNEKIKIDLASLLEPSVLLKNDAYLISADGRYYVNDPLLVRRTNLDGHLGSYITIIGKKMKWHLGPDFRYQLFSTYKSIYPTKEHLIDYGIRIGISK